MKQLISDFAGATLLTSSSRFLTRHTVIRFGFFMKSEMLSKAFLC